LLISPLATFWAPAFLESNFQSFGKISMPRVPAVDELNETERRSQLVAALTEGVMRYLQSDQYAVVRQQRQKDQDSDPH
jgi:hypothetical protein